MLHSRHLSTRSFGVVLLLGILSTGNLRAEEPRVAFELKSGWVEFSVRQDGKPIDGAVLQVLDEGGRKFAEGETGTDGESAFPMPSGSSCLVEIKTGARTADPIRLVKTDLGIEPSRVLLSYGLRPCCRSVIDRSTPDSPSDPIEPSDTRGYSVYLPIALALVACAGLISAARVWRFQRNKG